MSENFRKKFNTCEKSLLRKAENMCRLKNRKSDY